MAELDSADLVSGSVVGVDLRRGLQVLDMGWFGFGVCFVGECV
jgi:hypothetical protein